MVSKSRSVVLAVVLEDGTAAALTTAGAVHLPSTSTEAWACTEDEYGRLQKAFVGELRIALR